LVDGGFIERVRDTVCRAFFRPPRRLPELTAFDPPVALEALVIHIPHRQGYRFATCNASKLTCG
jgi:hypothetical protein